MNVTFMCILCINAQPGAAGLAAPVVLRCQNGGASFKSTRDCQRPGMFMSDCERKAIFLSDPRERVFTNAHVYLLMTTTVTTVHTQN